MANNIFTSIGSGIYKGMKLKLPSLKSTRSTKNIVKGSFFDSLRDELKGKVFVECFAGSGVMASEAISNGASKALGIEKDKNAFAILKQNFCNIDSKLIAYNEDCFKILPQILQNISLPIVLYVDPPFEIRDGFEDIYKKIADLLNEIYKFDIFIVCIEHMSCVSFGESIGKFQLKKSKKFGSTMLSYYIK